MNFPWAMEQLQANRRVRRASWASETTEAGTRGWHLFMANGYLGKSFWKNGIINGWGGSIGGAADDDPVRDGMLYSATEADRQAEDWELLHA